MKTEFCFNDVIARVKKALKINTDNELAELINMKPTTFNSRKKANSLPFDEILSLANSEKLDFNWLLTGEGEMYKTSMTNAVHECTSPYSNRRIQTMMKLMESLSERQQEEILLAAEDKERFNQLEQQIVKLTERLSA